MNSNLKYNPVVSTHALRHVGCYFKEALLATWRPLGLVYNTEALYRKVV